MKLNATLTPEELLNSLFLLPINEEKAKEVEDRNGIIKPFQDFYLAVYAEVEDASHDALFAKAMIPKPFFEIYAPNHTTEMIWETAKANTRLKFIPTLVELFTTFSFTGNIKQIPLLEDSLLNRETIYTLTTKDSFLYGSIFLTCNDVLDILCSRLSSKELYLACTSTHEIMIHPTDMFSADDIKVVLNATVEEYPDTNILLTTSVYKYTFMGELEIVA